MRFLSLISVLVLLLLPLRVLAVQGANNAKAAEPSRTSLSAEADAVWFDVPPSTIDTIAATNPPAAILLTLFSGRAVRATASIPPSGEAFLNNVYSVEAVAGLRDPAVAPKVIAGRLRPTAPGTRVHYNWAFFDGPTAELRISANSVDSTSGAVLGMAYPTIAVSLKKVAGSSYAFLNYSIVR
jgi:hypothetical protein